MVRKTRLMYLQYPYTNVKNVNFDEVIIVTPSEWKDTITKELSCTNINVQKLSMVDILDQNLHI